MTDESHCTGLGYHGDAASYFCISDSGSSGGSRSGGEEKHDAVNHNLKNSFTAIPTTIPAQYQPIPQHESVSGHNNMILFPCFVPASTTTSTHYLADEDKDRVNESVSASAAAATGSLENKDSANLNSNTMNTFTKRSQNKQDMLETSVEKAKDVVRRIMGGTRSDTSSQIVDHHNHNHHPHHHRLSINDINLHSYPYAQKRHEFLTQHYQKLHKYYIQNLDYLSKQDDIKLQQQENHLKFVKEKYATATQQQHEQQLIRRKRLYNCMGGIGNVKQKNFQKQLQNDDDNMVMSSSQSFVSRNGLCCGIYVTGLPLNSKGYSDNDDDDDDVVQSIKDLLMQLFSSFGKVSNVKLYRKKSGELKGDGLVVYDWSHHVRKEWMAKKRKEGQVVEEKEEEDKEMKDFLKMVCLQLNGVELPCNTILHAEPADMDYKNKENSSLNKQVTMEASISTPCQNGGEQMTSMSKRQSEETMQTNNEEEGPEEDPDLDDFFASLE